MNSDSQSFYQVIPHFIILVLLLFFEFTVFSTYGSSIMTGPGGDTAPLLGILYILTATIVILSALGLLFICSDIHKYKMIVSLNLILVIVQIVLIMLVTIITAVSV